MNLNELEALAKAVYGPSKNDWELRQALLHFDRAATPENIICLIELVRQMGDALEETTGLCENYQSVEEDDGYRFTEADAVIQQGREALAKYKELTK